MSNVDALDFIQETFAELTGILEDAAAKAVDGQGVQTFAEAAQTLNHLREALSRAQAHLDEIAGQLP